MTQTTRDAAPAHGPDVRAPAVAGRFYPAEPDALAQDVARHLAHGSLAPGRACALMAPHAGYVYSGQVAGRTFARALVPRRVILLCPNHTGQGPAISVMARGAYRIPGADVPVDSELAAVILAEVPEARDDRAAHAAEHAIEVELPFLLARQPDVRIVPIVLGMLTLDAALALGRGLHRAVCGLGAGAPAGTRAGASADTSADILVVVSSDMSHYLPDAQARAADRLALAPLLALDAEGLYRTVVTRDISMCGFVPATVMLSYARAAGAGTPELVAYATSGDAFGDTSRVVGYAGVIVPRPVMAGHGRSI